uniref:Uncharacterized protein n=1 Tax=Rhizophora mucronata TaxID=61149 RepID=A0A2P2QD91_RHIMU
MQTIYVICPGETISGRLMKAHHGKQTGICICLLAVRLLRRSPYILFLIMK